MSIFVSQNSENCSFSNSESWVILSPIEQSIKRKIEAVGKPLKDWDINIYRGILTGYNEAFIIDGKKKDQLIAEDPKSAEIIRPILRGRDIKRYGYEFADLWLINTHNGIKEKGLKPIDINNYHAIKSHLDNYYSQLEKRADKGDTPYNLRNCAYMDDFYKQKIIWGEISDRTKFCLDIEGEFVNEATTFLMTGRSLPFLLGFLNSKLSEYLFSKIGTTTGVGTVRWKKFTIEQLPVPEMTSTFKKIEELVLRIVQATNSKSEINELEKNLNNMIYEGLGFDENEKNFIENQ